MMATSTENSLPLAIHGGQPVRKKPMPARRALGAHEKAMMDEVYYWYHRQGLDPGYQGHFEELYCQCIVEYMGGGFADAVATGTVSLFVVLSALNLPKGSDVLVSPITDPGTLSAIILLGLRPKLVDAKPFHYNTGFEQVIARIDAKTSCVLAVHAAGQAVSDIEQIVEYCRARNIRVLEDCSQAHGARIHGRLVGTFGDMAAFSTMYRKASITGPTGGFIYTKNENYYHQALAHADRGKPRWRNDFNDRDPAQFLFPALNLHASEIACAIGLASWERLPTTIKNRQNFITKLSQRLKNESEICHALPTLGSDSPFYLPIFVNLKRIRCSKNDFSRAVMAEGIGLNPDYRYLVEEWPWVQSYLADTFHCEQAKLARDHSFCLYLNEHYGEEELDDVLAALLKVEKHFIK